MDFFYPHIQVGVTEPVLVTQVLDPRRVFCQLRSLSHEVQRLSESMHHYYELQAGYGDASMQHSFILGQPCASRGPDGCWYRSLLQEYIPDRRLAAVIHVDWGRRDVVPMTGLRSLAPDFFRMPVVTFPCSLYGVSDRGSGWDPAQVFELRSLLYGRQLTAKIEFYNSYEHLYVVNLFGDDGFNVNRLFDMRAHTLKVCQANRLMADGPVPVEEVCGNGKARVADVPKQQFYVPATPTQELKVGKFYDAFVEFVCDPSRFWIRIAENASNYSKVVNGVTRLYSQASKLDGIIPKPQRGQLCCTKFKDNQYYRAEVVATHEKKVTVYFIDYGNSETVDWYNVKELPAQFRDIPGSAIRCCLADIHPLGEEWSSEAIAAFKVAVVDKKLVIYIVCKESDNYTVEVLDQSRIEERSIGKVLADAGHAKFESHEPVEELPKLITAMAIGKENDVQLNDAVSSKKSHKTRQREPVPNRAKGDKAKKPMCSPFEDQFFEPGATIEVVVSSVDHPGLFWCQNVAHASDLNHLMNKIQEYCSSTSCPSDRRSSSCLARSPSDGQWYRGFVTETPVCASDSETVEVLYVDYGRKEMVPARDLRSIKSEFFNLKAQAFRCSLYNIIAPLGKDPFCWDAKATGLFNEFVEGASGKSVPFCCMFFAVASMDDEMFNIVDLFTPFTSVCNLLVERRHATPLSHKTLDPSVQLHSYFYSMHDIKIGCEEEIYVTHTNRSLEFYCQLSRNAGTVDEISSVVARASSKAQESKAPLGPLCLARFTDKQWYRGFICSNSSNPEVFFVDFGNTDKVNDKDLLPIKQNEYELLLFPMQAIKCSLSDVPPNVPSDIVSWFEKTVLDKPLRAIIVAKETDGKLIVELYSGNRQINTSIKSKLGLRSQKDTANALLHSASDNVRNGDTKKRAYNASKGETRDPGQRFYQVNSKRDESRSSQSVSRNAAPRQKADSAKDRMLSSETKPVLSNKSPQMRSFGDKLYKASPPQIKLKDLPKRNLFPGLQFPVYISHINSIYDFSVQIAQDAELCEISKILNETSKPEKVFEKDVQAGDLVCAFFADDELNYRAVVTEKSPDGLHVEYVDYGNTSVVPVSKVARLPEKLLSYPVMSFHCTLNRQSFGTSDDDLLHKFTERTNDLQLCCEFLRQCGDRWEVRLSDQQGSVTDFLTSSVSEEPPSAEPTDDLPANDAGDTTENVTSRDSFVWNLPQRGETVDVYVSAVDSPEHFWCQLTTSDVDGLAVKVQEAGELSIVDDCFISAIEVGSPCNVMYSDDNNWYRAAVTRIEAGLITVRFVDYGNEETVKADHVRQLPSALTTIPVVAFPCCLAGFNLSDGCWNSDANTFFYNRVTEDSLEITVVGIQPPGIGNIPMVSVSAKYKGEDINEEMRPFWCVGTDRGASASLTEDTKARCDSLEFETVSDTSLPDSDAPGDNIQENVDPQGNDEQEKQVAGDRECSGPWISSQGEAAIETGDGEERSPGYLFFNTRQDEAAAGDRAASQEDDMRGKCLKIYVTLHLTLRVEYDCSIWH
ncbi:tudor domain-containing protein 6 [Spea bombifrons]|uniref:tudor domain-containing protein 6 n=1 Tax=Spea bombifrons TaxID=233779 RepID=UPI00234AEFD6|nr:tudor domain-containing protein 6 [Spea bombifrons]